MEPSSTPMNYTTSKDDDDDGDHDECDSCTTLSHRPLKYPSYYYSNNSSSRRTPSFSSNSSSSLGSSSSFYNYDSPLSPATPLRISRGVPFSWEHFPGIPKKQHSKKIKPSSSTHQEDDHHSSLLLLPLPPTTTTSTTTTKKVFKKSTTTTTISVNNNKQPLKWDPFIAALVECSKDENDDHHDNHGHDHQPKFWNIATAKVSKSLSDRFGLINIYNNSSCKSTCAVAESIRHLPRSTRGSSYGHHLINSRPRN
ncbi:uncharacterized protein LOC115702357 [Cannabis sativa]|uniref:uncharacterized protein LOC115702357 n=1 Tax=Cannabis sativa TaxID=3483 RepID=UPI0029C9D458|nr:uncharacterized protein LOC115702357 [Cannabis sativa]